MSATKHRVPNLGERIVSVQTSEGRDKKIKFQVADVGKILLSVDKLIEAGNEVRLSKENPCIQNKKSGEITKLTRKRGQFILELWVKTDQVFHRPGR